MAEVARAELAGLAFGIAVPLTALVMALVLLLRREVRRGEGRVFRVLERAAQDNQADVAKGVELKGAAAAGSSTSSLAVEAGTDGERLRVMRQLGRISFVSISLMTAMFSAGLVMAVDLLGDMSRWSEWRYGSSELDDIADRMFRLTGGANYTCGLLLDGVPPSRFAEARVVEIDVADQVALAYAFVAPLVFFFLLMLLKAASSVMLESGLGVWRRSGIFLVFSSRLRRSLPLVGRVLLQLSTFTAFDFLFAVRDDCGTESIWSNLSGLFALQAIALFFLIGVVLLHAFPGLREKTPDCVGTLIRIVLWIGILGGLASLVYVATEDVSVSLSFPDDNITIVAVLKIFNLALFAADSAAAYVVYTNRAAFHEEALPEHRVGRVDAAMTAAGAV